MKLLIILTVCLSATFAKPVQTDSEKFECVANYLRDKKLLDKNFKYYVQSEQLDCDAYIKEYRETIMQKILLSSDSSSEETDLESIMIKELFNQRTDCFRLIFNQMDYPELVMKISIYDKSTKTPKKLKKKLSKAAEHDAEKKMNIAITLCFPEEQFGEKFDDLIEPSVAQNDSLEDKQNDYCARKYIVDNKLIDTSVYSVNINPDNIDVNINCTTMVEDLFEIIEEKIKEPFEAEGDQPRSQLRCYSKAIREGEISPFTAKIAFLSELTLTDEQKEGFRTEYINKMRDLYLDMVKCMK